MSRYVPAAGRFAPTRAYDAVMAATMREAAWRPRLIDAVVEAAEDPVVVDVGAGTGTLATGLASRARVIAVDGDPEALEIAASKAGAERVRWERGLAGSLPLEDESADRVVMSLLLHHLSREDKRAALGEARRVLRPAGRLLVADWGRPQDVLMRTAFLALRLADGFENTADHAAGRLPELIAASGFAPPTTLARLRTGFGTLELLRADRG